jgi:hypothetical protein
MLEFQEGTFLRPLAIIYKRGRELSPAVRKFIEVLTTSNLVPRARVDKNLSAGVVRVAREHAGGVLGTVEVTPAGVTA